MEIFFPRRASWKSRMSRWTNKKYFPSSCSHLCVTFLCGKLLRGHFMIRKIALAFAEAPEILEFILNQFLAAANAGYERRHRRKKKKIHSLIMCSCLPLPYRPHSPMEHRARWKLKWFVETMRPKIALDRAMENSWQPFQHNSPIVNHRPAINICGDDGRG